MAPASPPPAVQTPSFAGLSASRQTPPGSTRRAQFGDDAATGSGSAAVVRFATGSAELVSNARKTLRLVANLHREQGGTIRVVGHASARTHEMPVERHKMVNFGVSLRRAQVVADALIRLGVTPEAISVGAMSDNEPIYHEWMPSGEAGNRRAEIFLDY
jgi:outer membrane protein OmpA-like peptidoglycan-associated protein